MLVKVTGSNYVRDTNSMALLSTDSSEKTEYYNRLRLVKKQKEEINTIKSEIDSLKTDVSEIKQMVAQLLGKSLNV
jgi:uncharacterized coiled-coil DUF342 family protein